MGVPRTDGDVIAQRAIHRRGGVEPHVRAEVVVAPSGLLAVGVRPLRFDRHPLSDARRIHPLADTDDGPRSLVTQHQRLFDEEAAHPTMTVVMRVRPTDSDGRHPYQHVAWRRRGYRPLVHLDPTWLNEYGGSHRGIWGKCCVRHNLHANVMSIYSHVRANAHRSGRGKGEGLVAISTSNGEVAGTIGGQAVPMQRDRTSTPEDLRLALRAATLYYLDGLTQAEIAAKLGVSRPTAGRLVARAKAKGLVRIEVVVPPTMKDDLHAEEERLLEERYGLTEAVVSGHLGRASAALLMRRLSEDDV